MHIQIYAKARLFASITKLVKERKKSTVGELESRLLECGPVSVKVNH